MDLLLRSRVQIHWDAFLTQNDLQVPTEFFVVSVEPLEPRDPLVESPPRPRPLLTVITFMTDILLNALLSKNTTMCLNDIYRIIAGILIMLQFFF